MFFQLRDGIGGLRCCNLHTSLHAPEKIMAAPWKRNIVLMIIWWTHCIRFFGDVKGLWVGKCIICRAFFFVPKYLAGLGSHGGIGSDGIGSLELESQQDWGGWVPGVEGDAYLLLKVLLCKHAAKVNKRWLCPSCSWTKMVLMKGFMRFFMGGSSTKSQGSSLGKSRKSILQGG